MQTQQVWDPYKVWVLAPELDSLDPHILTYYDFSQSRVEHAAVFDALEVEWEWLPVSLRNFRQQISRIRRTAAGKIPLVFNLCDGDEVNGAPGISVIRELDRRKLTYTGAGYRFYNLTSSKIPMKIAFDQRGISTPGWEEMAPNEPASSAIFDRLGSPLIIKPAVSGGSMGLSAANVVADEKALTACLQSLKNGYRGWQLTTGGIIAERFVTGREFTVLLVGSAALPDRIICYPAAERIFPDCLPETEQFLSFDGNWGLYEDESRASIPGPFYRYLAPEPEIRDNIEQLSLAAYLAVGGTGYGRVDLRMDKSSGRLYVLEVNAQCGLSADEQNASVGAILRLAGKNFEQLHIEIMQDAINRFQTSPSISLTYAQSLRSPT
ncbi:MAG TPA: hypothetical protein PKE06_23035 [Flavilitoribacter sp.]|nr:hypothetical protein [Flavilitoribacter sp.]HMQ88467.1 hypothetical protein [Flavilitoribacter sp.]